MDHSNPKLFSVLVANFNNGRYIAECLDSILAQTHHQIEIIVVDDCSTDNSMEQIRSYQTSHKNILCFSNDQNYGVGYTKKKCIDVANGEICAFLDPDDTITEDAVAQMMVAHQAHPDAALIYSDYYECDETLKVTGKYESAQIVNHQHDFFNEEGKIGHFASFKKAYYNQTPGLNVNLKRAIDQDLYCKLYDVGKCIHLPALLYHYRMHAKGLSTQAQANLAYYWYWVVCMLRAQEKGINLENKFESTFARKTQINYLLKIDSFIRRSWLYQLYRSFK